MTTDYQSFLASKRATVRPSGFDVAPSELSPRLFKYQADVVRWALRLGKAALFEECGLGKTFQFLEWSRMVVAYTGRPVLIGAPLGAAKQHVEEGLKFGVPVVYVRDQTEVDLCLSQSSTRMFVANYENLHKFDASRFAGFVLDESSVLKAFTGATKRLILKLFRDTPYKLAASATPAPNDHLELGNHAEFLDVMPSNEMIARWFINDSMKAGNYRLKGHAEKDFWRWLTSWAVCISKPRDLGDDYDMPGFDLPPLSIVEHLLPAGEAAKARARDKGKLYADDSVSATKLHAVKRESLPQRIALARSIADGLPSDDYLILWCDTNDESAALVDAFPDALEVRGSHSQKVKEERLAAFTHGDIRQIVTKAEIAGLGLNWQRYASPVWFDVDQTRVLRGYQKASDGQDEKHICPLQLDVIDRAIDLWSNRGETVLDKFAGIGSTGYEALLMGRKHIGIELKPSYFEMNARKLAEAEEIAAQPTLFDLIDDLQAEAANE